MPLTPTARAARRAAASAASTRRHETRQRTLQLRAPATKPSPSARPVRSCRNVEPRSRRYPRGLAQIRAAARATADRGHRLGHLPCLDRDTSPCPALGQGRWLVHWVFARCRQGRVVAGGAELVPCRRRARDVTRWIERFVAAANVGRTACFLDLGAACESTHVRAESRAQAMETILVLPSVRHRRT